MKKETYLGIGSRVLYTERTFFLNEIDKEGTVVGIAGIKRKVKFDNGGEKWIHDVLLSKITELINKQ